VLVAWVVAVVGAVALVGIQVIRRARKRSRRVFVIVSAFDEKYYIAEFVRQLNNALDRVNIDLVLKVPDRDSDASAQAHHLERVLERKHDYMGGVIFAGTVHALRDDLAMFCQRSRLRLCSPIWNRFRNTNIRTTPSMSATTPQSSASRRAGGW
jgi:hypothetical protein